MTSILPVGTFPQPLEYSHFPTRQQAFIWRNWELVPPCRIAQVLGTREENILRMAEDMGLRVPPCVGEHWMDRGYITIIRRNWHLLNYGQLLELLGWTEEKLAYTLKEDDFLWVKLGNLKPDVQPLHYKPLTEEEAFQTREIRLLMQKHFPHSDQEDPSRPFDFLQTFYKRQHVQPAAYGPPQAGEITIDHDWKIVYSHSARRIGPYLDRYLQEYEERWGIRLNRAGDMDKGKTIILEIHPEAELPPESHHVAVEDDRVCITAVDGEGLIRGLQWMERAMEERRGPFLKKGAIRRKSRFDLRLIYSYFAVYGDPLLEPDVDPYPEELLYELSKSGVNGIWLQGVLYKLVPWEEAPELSQEWEKRIEGLQRLVRRAGQYGIGVYLYLNEPRAMPIAFFEKHPDWKGVTEGEFATLCTSQEPVREYLRKSTARLFREVPDLAGVFTITMSENLTNCYSHSDPTNCPRCSSRPPYEVVAEVNRLIAGGAHSVKPDARILCWTWGWNPQWKDAAISCLPPNVTVMATGEEGIPTAIGGVPGQVLDYAMSIPGPGERALSSWKRAAERGLDAAAKVQFNNTWECSAVPYLPVLQLVEARLEGLVRAGVNSLMLSWTVGGYPSYNLRFASRYYWQEEEDPGDKSLQTLQDRLEAGIKEACSQFSKAFREFPFHVGVVYTAPQNFGPANLLFERPTGYRATMIGFPYDDVDTWRSIYPADVLEEQFRRLSGEWQKGLELLRGLKKDGTQGNDPLYLDLERVAAAACLHFRSTYLQIAYNRLRNSLYSTQDPREAHGIIQRIFSILDEEVEAAKALEGIVGRDSRIGYEASNHYYYTTGDLREKVINCECIRNFFLDFLKDCR